LSAIVLEVLRFSVHGQLYGWRQWLIVIASLCMNTSLIFWTLPDTYPKVVLVAFYTQWTLPGAFFYLWGLINKMPMPPSLP